MQKSLICCRSLLCQNLNNMGVRSSRLLKGGELPSNLAEGIHGNIVKSGIIFRNKIICGEGDDTVIKLRMPEAGKLFCRCGSVQPGIRLKVGADSSVFCISFADRRHSHIRAGDFSVHGTFSPGNELILTIKKVKAKNSFQEKMKFRFRAFFLGAALL